MSEDVAHKLEKAILGSHRKAMPCGCVLAVLQQVDLSNGQTRVRDVLSFSHHRCEAHRTNGCPYINQVLDE